MNNNLQLVLKSSTTEMSLNDHDAGIYIVPELDGLTGLPEIRTTSGVNAGYDGGWTSAQKFDARSIVIRGVIANEDKTEVERMRRELVALLAQGKNEQLELDFVTETGRAYEVQVRTIACDMAMQRVLTQQEFMLQLRADDPLIYDASETGHEALLQVAQATGGFTIDFELPLAITGSSEETVVNNEGLEQVPTVTRMYGELHNPKIINQTTNQFMQIEADLGFAEGDWIEPSEVVSGKDITINGAPEGAPLSSVEIDGETSQNGTPTPDAPQAVQTVTGENVVKICGKNLFNVSAIPYVAKRAYGSDGSELVWNNYSGIDGYQQVAPNTTYTITKGASGSVSYLCEYDKNKAFIQRKTDQRTFTTTANTHYLRWSVYSQGDVAPTQTQLELGSTATTYEPYQEQSYEVNLGNIELCKIGDYQDYIYKDGSDWKIHKATRKVILDGTESWSRWSTPNEDTIHTRAFTLTDSYYGTQMPLFGSIVINDKSDRFVLDETVWSDARLTKMALNATSSRSLQIKLEKTYLNYTDTMTSAELETLFKAWLAAHNTTLYYILATPTDTEITNQALIAQLEAILQEARMHNPQTNITTIYAGGNEQGTLSISYFTDKNPDTRDELIIDSRLRTITLNGLDVYHLQAPGSEFLMLAPGENRLSLQSDITGDNGYAKVSYKQGYLSI